MAIESRSLTFEDLQRMRGTSHDRLELIDGELFVTPSPTRLHQLVAKRLTRLLLQAIDDAGVGEFYFAPFDVKLADDSVVQPDLLAVTCDRRDRLQSAGVEGAPDFAVEIVSPSTGRADRGLKRDLYARFGVAEYWLVDPDAGSITIFSDPVGDHYRGERIAREIAVSVVFPELSVDLAELFSPVPDALSSVAGDHITAGTVR
jgi:Uma2 family endonuclease